VLAPAGEAESSFFALAWAFADHAFGPPSLSFLLPKHKSLTVECAVLNFAGATI
jgi:hypothetical protein